MRNIYSYYSSSSFLKASSRLVDLFGLLDRDIIEKFQTTAKNKPQSDWDQVGKDLSKALDDYGNNRRQIA